MSVDESALAPPELPDGFERVVWARLQPELQRTRRGWLSRLMHRPQLGWAAAALVLAAGSFYARSSLAGGAAAARAGRWHGAGLEPAAGATAAGRPRRSPGSLAARARRVGECRRRSAGPAWPASANAPSSWSPPTGSIATPRQPTVTRRSWICSISSNGCWWRWRPAPRPGPPRSSAEVRHRIESGSLLFKVRVVSSDLQERRKAAVRQTGQRSSL